MKYSKGEAGITPGESSGSPAAIQSELLTPQDLYEQFRIPESPQKVWRWQTRHNMPDNPKLPYIKLRQRVLYPRKEILAWVFPSKAFPVLKGR